MDRRGLLFAACYGAVVTTVAYLLARGSLVWFIAVMAIVGVAMRAWALWYRRRRGLPMRRVRPHREPE